VSNGALARPQDAVEDNTVPGGVLVDEVDGDVDVVYRHFRAAWMRIVPFDEFDKDAVARCKTYALRILPLSGAPSSA
jgi:hypothetical protein